METTDIVQIVSVCLTVVGFLVSEILALYPDVKANGLAHWLYLYAQCYSDRPRSPTPSHNDLLNIYALERYPDGTLGRPRLTTTPTRDLEYDSEATIENDVSRQNQ